MPRMNCCGLALAVVMLSASPQEQASAASAAAPRVHTTYGWVRGQQSQSYQRFLGIPYSAPPVRALRWKPPQPAVTWPQDHEATKFAPECPHVPEPGDDTPMPPMSEDCDWSSTYGPQQPTANTASVMVFMPTWRGVHGGWDQQGV